MSGRQLTVRCRTVLPSCLDPGQTSDRVEVNQLTQPLATEAYALVMSFDGTTVALHWLAADAAAEDRDE